MTDLLRTHERHIDGDEPFEAAPVRHPRFWSELAGMLFLAAVFAIFWGVTP